MYRSRIDALRGSTLAAVRDLDPDAVAVAVNVLADVRLARGVVLTGGNGGSDSTASHFAADLAKYTRSAQRPHFRAISLTDNVPCHSAWTNDDAPALALVHMAEPWLPGPGHAHNAVVLFSVHGGARDGSVSGNLIELARFARAAGAAVIAVTGFDGGALGDVSDVHINVPMDREPLATPGIESVHLLIAHALCLALSDKEC